MQELNISAKCTITFQLQYKHSDVTQAIYLVSYCFESNAKMECTVKLHRDSLLSPWGFRLQGGADLNSNLSIQRVSINYPMYRHTSRTYHSKRLEQICNYTSNRLKIIMLWCNIITVLQHQKFYVC